MDPRQIAADLPVKFRDYYEILGLSREATQDEVRKAFRKLARKYHPDVAEDKATAQEKFKEINEAYEVLGDAEKRKKYDTLGANWNNQGGPPPGAYSGFGSGEDFGDAFHFEGTGFSDFFENYFSGRATRGGFGQARPGAGSSVQRRGRDIESEILVTLDEVMTGSERSLVMQAKRGAEKKTVRIRIPKGVTEGQLIRCAGLGQEGAGGGGPGDLFLHVHVERHPDFRVDGHDLYYDLRLAPWEAVLGATVAVNTPHGSVRIKVPPASESGTEFRLVGKGLPKGSAGGFGNLFAVTRIVMPGTLSAEEEKHWKALAAASTFNPRG